MKQTNGRRSWAWLGVAFLLVGIGVGHSEEPRGDLDPAFLAQAVRSILDEARGAVEPAEEVSNGAEAPGEAVGAASDQPSRRGRVPPTRAPGAKRDRSRRSPIAGDEQGGSRRPREATPRTPPPSRRRSESWRQLGFAAGSYRPEPGLDPELAAAASVLSKEGRRNVYGFVLLREYLTDASRSEIEALGVKILGPHGTSHKARFPAERRPPREIGALGSVEWLGFSKREQKLSPELKAAIAPASEAPDKLPVMINLFESVAAFKEKLEASGRRGREVRS